MVIIIIITIIIIFIIIIIIITYVWEMGTREVQKQKLKYLVLSGNISPENMSIDMIVLKV